MVDLTNPATYSGVPINSYTPGQLVQTGLLGPSKVGDYGGQPIYAPDGTQLTNPNYVIPAGAYISIGVPPSAGAGAGNVVTGTGITAQGITKEQVEGDLANNAQANANQVAIAQAQLQQSAQQAAQQFAEAQASYNLSVAQAQQQYQVDVASFGLNKAQALYNARLGQANLILQQSQAKLANAQFLLQQNQFNASQAQAKETARENILNMLNSRTGPQDYVAYNNLLNGLNAPNPQKSTTVDPFAGLDALYQPSNIQPPEVPQLPDFSDVTSAINGIQMPAQVSYPAFPSNPAPSAPTINAPTITGTPSVVGPYGNPINAGPNAPGTTTATGGTAANPYGAQPGGKTAPLPGGGSYVGIPLTDVQSLGQGQGKFVVTGANGPFDTSTLTPGFQLYGINGTQLTGTVAGSTPVYITKGGAFPEVKALASGGQASNPPMAIVGEGHGREPARTSEIAIAGIDPATGRPVLRVINHEQAKPIIDRARLPRAADGGTYGTALNGNTITTNLYSPDTLGSLPFYRKLTGQSPNREFGGFGATVSNPAQGIYNAPTAVNLRNYNALLPSEQSMFTSLYGQGLSLNPDDILAMAQRAAPTTKGYTATVYGG